MLLIRPWLVKTAIIVILVLMAIGVVCCTLSREQIEQALAEFDREGE